MCNHRTRHCTIRYAGIYVLVPIRRQELAKNHNPVQTDPIAANADEVKMDLEESNLPSEIDTDIVDYYVLSQLRAPTLGGYILGCGGGVNSREAVKHGVLRELMEEAQLDVLSYPNRGLHLFSVSHDLACYYIVVDELPKVKGPELKHAWEVNRSFDPWDCPGAITIPKTGHAWLPLTQIRHWLSTHPNWENKKFIKMITLLKELLL
jgi:8-oxo-dGTP pyrophosphatase MutT (NUDIX family)